MYSSDESSATSPSSKKINSFVQRDIASGSEAARNSSTPIPINKGDLFLAMIIFFESSLSIAAIAYAPSSFSFVRYIESSIELPLPKKYSSIWAINSESVWEEKL